MTASTAPDKWPRRRLIRGARCAAWFELLWFRLEEKGFWAAIAFCSARTARWLSRWAWNGRLVWYWRLSRRIAPADIEERNTICRSCPSWSAAPGRSLIGRTWSRFLRRLAIPRKLHVTACEDGYCNSCGCPKWTWARLTIKNQRWGHDCPLGKHPGSTPREERAKVGCPGCGGGSGGVAQPPPQPAVLGGVANVHETSTVGNNGSVGVYGTGATATAFAGVATIADVGDRGI